MELFGKSLETLRQMEKSKKPTKKSEINPSTIKSKSNIEPSSDEDFEPIKPIRTKSKLKSRLSLNVEQDSPEK